MRLSGNALLLDSKKKSIEPLADSAAFRDVHPAIIGYLEEFGPVSGIVTPIGEQQPSTEDVVSIPVPLAVPPPYTVDEPWQLYLGAI